MHMQPIYRYVHMHIIVKQVSGGSANSGGSDGQGTGWRGAASHIRKATACNVHGVAQGDAPCFRNSMTRLLAPLGLRSTQRAILVYVARAGNAGP